MLPLLSAQRATSDSALKSLVLTEQSFSKMAELQGTREAFLTFIADDGILFRPTAVKGKEWLLAHPPPASQKRPLLAWQPRFADVSSSGELGYTTGPWEFKGDIKDEKPAAFGDFITVWKKQPDGTWKFAVDLGISHPGSSGPLELMRIKSSPVTREPKLTATPDELVARDNDFTQTVQKLGPARAFALSVAPTFRLFSDGNAPFVGKKPAMDYLASKSETIAWQPAGDGVSKAGDLGYVYGTYEARNTSAEKPERGNYLRIWKKQGMTWRIVLEVHSKIQQ